MKQAEFSICPNCDGWSADPCDFCNYNRKTKTVAIQSEIEGTSRPDAVPEIDEAAEAYFSTNEELKTLKKTTAAKRSVLAKRMQDAGITKYIWVDGDVRKVVTFDTVGEVKMRNPKKDEEDE